MNGCTDQDERPPGGHVRLHARPEDVHVVGSPVVVHVWAVVRPDDGAPLDACHHGRVAHLERAVVDKAFAAATGETHT